MCYRTRTFAIFCLVTFSVACGAEPRSVSGTVYDDKGEPFAEAPIQLIDNATGAVRQLRTEPDGRYLISEVAAGTYTFSITMPCCEIDNFFEENLEVGPGGRQFDVHMVEGESLNTLGDDPAVLADLLRARQRIPDLAPPKRADGKSDLSGVWLIGSDPFPATPDLTDWAAAINEQRLATVMRDAPHTRCLPQGMPIPGAAPPFMTKLVQTDELLVILFEDAPGFRQVFLDGREHPIDPNPSWTGHSIGEWDGDTLVVDTVGYNDRAWLGPHPVTEAMHMVERYRRTDYGVMELQVTYEDPAVFNQPLVENRRLDLAPQEELMEYVCENNKWARAYTDPD